MKSNFPAKRILLTAAILFSIAGFAVRYLQLTNELLPDGTLTSGAYLHYVLAILTVCFAAGIAILLWKMQKVTSWRQCFPPKFGYEIVHLLAAGLLLIGNAVLFIQSSSPENAWVAANPFIGTFIGRLLPFFGVAAAVCLGIFAVKCQSGQRPSPAFYMIFSLYLIIRLIVCFQSWNTDPSVNDYCYALLAAICTMLSAFQLAGFSFDRGKRRIALFWTLTSVLFCSISLADAIYDGGLGTLLVVSALLVTNITSSLQLLYARCPAAETKAAAETEEA